MRALALVLAPLLLAGCSSEPAEDVSADEAAMADTADSGMVTMNGSTPGTYQVTDSEGTVTTTVLNADGTYSDTAADGSLLAEGTWAVTDNKTCFTPTTEGVEPMCYTESIPGADGSFAATPEEGEAVQVKPVMS